MRMSNHIQQYISMSQLVYAVLQFKEIFILINLEVFGP